MELIACDCQRKCEKESCSSIQMGMACTKACFAKSFGKEEDPNQAVIYMLLLVIPKASLVVKMRTGMIWGS